MRWPGLPWPGRWLLGSCATVLWLYRVLRTCSAYAWKPHTVVEVEPGPVWAFPPLWSLIRGLVRFLVNDIFVQLGIKKQEAP